jgi:ankyrin repeat protein
MNTLGRARRTPLHLALASGHLRIVELLLERGANPNVWNSHRQSPRQEALAFNDVWIAELLLKHGSRET